MFQKNQNRSVVPAFLRAACLLLLLLSVSLIQPDSASAQNFSPKTYDFSLPCLRNGDATSFEDLAASGLPFILVWWKSDCPHCQRELPYVQQLASLSDAGKLNLKVISINVDKDIDDCIAIVDKRKLSFPVLSDPDARKTDSKFNVWAGDGLPLTFLFEPGGCYAGNLRSDQSDYVDKVLDKLELTVNEHDARLDPLADMMGQKLSGLVKNRAAWLIYDHYIAPLVAAQPVPLVGPDAPLPADAPIEAPPADAAPNEPSPPADAAPEQGAAGLTLGRFARHGKSDDDQPSADESVDSH